MKPYDGELLSSWLERLSRAYRIEARRFCAGIWPHAAFWNRNIDKGIDADVLQILVDHTATPPARVRNTTLWEYRGFPAWQLYGSGCAPWLLGIGLRNTRRLRP